MHSPHFHLVTHTLCPYVQRSVIVLKEKGISYQRSDIDLANTPHWFRKISPMNRVPVLIVDEDKALFESAVICEYLNEITPGSLHPSDPLEKAFHRSWIEFGSGLLDSIGGLYCAKSKKSFEEKQLEIQNKFHQLENELQGASFFSGEIFQLIDAVYGPIFRYFDVFDQVMDLGLSQSFPKISQWRVNLASRQSVKEAVINQYSANLLEFVRERNSFMSQLVEAPVAD